MGRAGRERVERYFSVERMLQKTEALYEELIGEKMEGGGRRRSMRRRGYAGGETWTFNGEQWKPEKEGGGRFVRIGILMCSIWPIRWPWRCFG